MGSETTHPEKKGSMLYQAPRLLVAGFYLVIIIWTFISVPLLVAKASRSELSDILQLITIIGVFCFTWYFSLNIFYRIRLDADGSIQLDGVRTSRSIHPRDIKTVEGPYLPIGFVRFKWGKEKLYLLCSMRDEELLSILKRIGRANPSIRFKTR